MTYAIALFAGLAWGYIIGWHIGFKKGRIIGGREMWEAAKESATKVFLGDSNG